MLTKITDEDREGKGVTGLPDTPNLNTAQMQEQFDSLGNLAINGLNTVVDELSDTENGAGNIGAAVPEGLIASQNVQSILNALAVIAHAAKSVSHTHANKAVLDAITVQQKAGYDRIVTLLSSVLSIEAYPTNTQAAVPTSAAVLRLLEQYAYSDLKDTLYPIGTVYFSENTTSPETFIGGVWERITLISGVYSWRRTG